MIWVTRLNGTEVVVNADLIESVEATPDTVVTLVDGKKYLVAEDPAEVMNRVREFRASILATVEYRTAGGPPPEAADLYVIPTPGRDAGRDARDDEGR